MDQPAPPVWWARAGGVAVVPVAAAVVTVVGTYFASAHQPEARSLDVIGMLALVVGPVALPARHAYPRAVLVVAVLSAGSYLAAGYPFGPVFLAVLIALAGAVIAGHRPMAWISAAATVVVLFAVFVLRYSGDPAPWPAVGFWTALLAAVIAVGEVRRSRRERLAHLRAAREAVARRRSSEERLRIAQELHDVLGHHVSLINVQAGVALFLMDEDPEQARTALTAIKQSSHDLLGEMRTTLGVLRGVDREPPHQPVPGMAQLDTLIDDTRAAGLPVDLETVGEPRSMPPTVDLAGYRIVQEALTNVRRHAPGARASVRVEVGEEGVTVEVVDDGRPDGNHTHGDDVGNGLAGIRERARALGGWSEVGPRPEGGFRVHAHLPVRSVDGSSAPAVRTATS